MERFINILIIDNDIANTKQLVKILSGGGNNLIVCENEEEAWPIINKRKIGIILLNIHNKQVDSYDLLQRFRANSSSKDAYKIVIGDENSSVPKLVKGLREGAVDYISSPFNTNLVKAKIEVYKSLYFKDERISQLLENIFPINVLNDLNITGKYSPRKVEDGVVLFTDFVAFTKMAKQLSPLELIKNLEQYFTKFDEIIERYNLEKIKTVGDAYMALAGVTEQNSEAAVRASLAALEIRNFILDQKRVSEATDNASWNIRIGIHSGPLLAGIISSKKISFDVWGDTVNIASRAEQNSEQNSITITQNIANKISKYFNITHRGEINFKHGGFAEMYFIDELKREFSMFKEGRLPSSSLRKICNLPEMDFEYTRRYTINKLKALLPEEVDYHSIKHTINVEKAAIRIATLEGVKDEELILLRTAVLYHDAGYIFKYTDNEEFGMRFAQSELPKFGYRKEQIQIVCDIIEATKLGAKPKTLLEKIMCDADNDYLGRADYHSVAKTLRKEYENRGKIMTELEWIDFQLNYLVNIHRYHTLTAINIRKNGKKNRIKELKEMRKKYL